MLPPSKFETDSSSQAAQMFAGREVAKLTTETREPDDPDQRLVEHWQKLFAERHARNTGSA
jgi:hypothetical protein